MVLEKSHAIRFAVIPTETAVGCFFGGGGGGGIGRPSATRVEVAIGCFFGGGGGIGIPSAWSVPFFEPSSAEEWLTGTEMESRIKLTERTTARVEQNFFTEHLPSWEECG
jgi:hypothetical protein